MTTGLPSFVIGGLFPVVIRIQLYLRDEKSFGEGGQLSSLPWPSIPDGVAHPVVEKGAPGFTNGLSRRRRCPSSIASFPFEKSGRFQRVCGCWQEVD
jgi:hypothetical protein